MKWLSFLVLLAGCSHDQNFPQFQDNSRIQYLEHVGGERTFSAYLVRVDNKEYIVNMNGGIIRHK